MHFKIYTQPDCSWCQKAKDLITKLGHTYQELIVGKDVSIADFAKIGKTVPQIFKNDLYIGGFTQLWEYLEGTSGGYGDGF